MENSKKVAIVTGAGVAGLAAAIRLRAQGYSVQLLEANDFTGGKLSEIRLGAWRFDAGPSLFTMPHLVEELFWLSGKSSDSFKYKKLDEVCRYFFPDGQQFSMPAHRRDQIKILSNELGENEQVLEKYLRNASLKFETIGKLFLEKCLRKPSTFLDSKAWKAYLNIHKLGLFESLHQLNSRHFQNPKTIQLFNRYATYNGSNPYQTPAVMSMIPHLELGIGAFFPEDGMIQITNALDALAREVGVDFFLQHPVEAIRLQQGTNNVEITAGGKKFAGDLLVSALDVERTYQLLGKENPSAFQYTPQEKSTSAIIFYWALSKKFAETGLHNIFFSTDYQAEFKALFEEKTMPADPTIYLNISVKENAGDAPPNGENWFVMVNAPVNEGQNWPQLVQKTRERVLVKLEKLLGRSIGEYIENETHLDPISLENRTGSVGGALYGSSSNHRMAAFLRHANFSSKIPHIYFCGGTVHPGGGIPLALQSAAIACDYVREREKS